MKTYKKIMLLMLLFIFLTVNLLTFVSSAAATDGIAKVNGYNETQLISFDSSSAVSLGTGASIDTQRKIEGAASGKLSASGAPMWLSAPEGGWNFTPLNGGESFITFWMYVEGASRDEVKPKFVDSQIILTDNKNISVSYWLKNNMYQSNNEWVYLALPLKNDIGLDPTWVLGKTPPNFGTGPAEFDLTKTVKIEFRKNSNASPIWIDDCKIVKNVRNTALTCNISEPSGIKNLFGINGATHWATVPTTINSPSWGTLVNIYSQDSRTVGFGIEGKTGPNDIQFFGQFAATQSLDTGIGGINLQGGDPLLYSTARNLYITCDVFIGNVSAIDTENTSLVIFGNQNGIDDNNNMTFYLKSLKVGWNRITLPFNYGSETLLQHESANIVRKGLGPVNNEGLLSIGGARWLINATGSTQMIISNFGVYYKTGQMPDDKPAAAISENTGAKITLNWIKASNNMNGNVGGYIIVRDYYDDLFESYINPVTFKVSGANTTSFTDTDIAGETKYRYKIYAVEDVELGIINAIAQYGETIVTSPKAPDIIDNGNNEYPGEDTGPAATSDINLNILFCFLVLSALTAFVCKRKA